MSTDFRVNRILTLATTDNALAGIRAIRNAVALTYKLARVALSQVSLGAAFQIVDSSFVSAQVDRENATPTRYLGDGTGAVTGLTLGGGGTGYTVNDVLTLVQTGGSGATITVLTVSAGVIATFSITTAGTGYAVANGLAVTGGTGTGATFNVTTVDGTAAFAIASLHLKSSHKGRQGTDTNDAPGVTFRTYASGYALASGETYKVKVDGVLKTLTTHYTVSGTDIVFVYTFAPAHGADVKIFAESSYTPLTNEVVTVSVAGTIKTLTTHYTIGSGIVTFTAGNVPTAGQMIAIWFRTPGTRAYTLASATGTHAGSSTAGVIKVYVATVLKTLTTDYTVAAGVVTFNADKIPADGAAVQFRWEYANNNVFTIPGVAAEGDDAAVEVWVDTTQKTVTTHYTITNRVITFETAGLPAAGTTVKAISVSAYAGIVPAGFVTYFDTQRLNTPAWDYIRAGASTVVEVM